MGWLDLLFGKGTTKKVNAIKKIAKVAKPKEPPPQKIERPKLEWTKSENGNDTALLDDHRITLFKKDGAWNYCVVYVLDEDEIADGLEEDPIFGCWYETKAEARREALYELGYD